MYIRVCVSVCERVLQGFDVEAPVVIPDVVTGITGSRSAVRRTNATLPFKDGERASRG